MRWWVAMGMGLFWSLACGGGGEPTPPPEPEPVPEPEPIPAVRDKVSKLIVPRGLEQRSVWLHVPAGSTREELQPMLVIFHGASGGDGRRIAEWFAPWFDKGVVLAFPNVRREGEEAGRGKKGKALLDRGWGMGPRGFEDDLAFVESMVDQIRRSVGVDDKRVYATGFAQGAAMTWQVACNASKVFAGFAPVADTLPRPLAQACPAEGGRPLMLVAGTEDKVALWSGRQEAISVMDSVGIWLTKDGCDKASEKVEDLPDTVKDDGSTVKRHTWTCDRAPVTLLEIEGGGHAWPRPDARGAGSNRDIDTAAEIMRFFGLDQLRAPEG